MTGAFSSVPVSTEKPRCFIAHTVKGKGISYMENNKKWHHGVPDENQYNLAMEELERQLESYQS
jgi:transketolase